MNTIILPIDGSRGASAGKIMSTTGLSGIGTRGIAPFKTGGAIQTVWLFKTAAV